MFNSFIMAGFECTATHNRRGRWIDQLSATQHDVMAEEDYRMLTDLGIATAREGVRWPLIDREGTYDFSSLEPFLQAADRTGMELIYDLFHFGYPDDVDIFSPDFPARFANYCFAAANFICSRASGRYYFTPVNEPSYFAWAAGEAALFAPFCNGRGPELKRILVHAAIQGIDAIRSVCNDARIVNADALCRIVSPRRPPHHSEYVSAFNNRYVFESWDMLGGRLCPELGGSDAHLDIIGINYYWTNQWVANRPGRPLEDTDPRRMSISALVENVYKRYGHKMIISETSHVEKMRPIWMRELTREIRVVLQSGIPLHGVCIYPILGMPEWHQPSTWTRMGVWDLEKNEDGKLLRTPYLPYIEAIQEAADLEDLSRGYDFSTDGV